MVRLLVIYRRIRRDNAQLPRRAAWNVAWTLHIGVAWNGYGLTVESVVRREENRLRDEALAEAQRKCVQEILKAEGLWPKPFAAGKWNHPGLAAFGRHRGVWVRVFGRHFEYVVSRTS